MKIYCVYSLCLNSSDEWLECACTDFNFALSFYNKESCLNCYKNYYIELRAYDVPDSDFFPGVTIPVKRNIIFTSCFSEIDDSYLCNYDLLRSSKNDNN